MKVILKWSATWLAVHIALAIGCFAQEAPV